MPHGRSSHKSLWRNVVSTPTEANLDAYRTAGTAQVETVDATPLLAVRDVALRFGGIIALDGVSFDLEKGQILGLIGPNGAGKTTLFNCLSRLYTPDRGDIR